MDRPETLAQIRGEIDRTIGGAEASNLLQCRIAAIGVRPCGGPRAWRAYSVAVTDSVELASLIERYNRLDRERNEREGLVSTCEMLPEPGVALEEGRCVTEGRQRTRD